jgi:hypothetical protein
MSKGLLFWILMILSLVFSLWVGWPSVSSGHYIGMGGNLLTFVLFGLLGWQVFGAPIK